MENNFENKEENFVQEEPKPSVEKKQPNLKIFLYVFFAILFLAGLVYAVIYFVGVFSYEEAKEVEEEIGFVKEDDFDTVAPDVVEDELELEASQFIVEVEEFLLKEFVESDIEKYEVSRSLEDKRGEEFGGLEWFFENGDVGLIKKYEDLSFDVSAATADMELDKRDALREVAKGSLPNIFGNLETFFMQEGFEKSSFEMDTSKFFEKDGVLCKIYLSAGNWFYIISRCGEVENLEVSEVHTDMYDFYDRKNEKIVIYNVYEDFAVLTRSGREFSLGGGWVIAQNVNGNWEEKVFVQEPWNCNQLFEWGVKPELFSVEGEELLEYRSECYDDDFEVVEYEEYYQERI